MTKSREEIRKVRHSQMLFKQFCRDLRTYLGQRLPTITILHVQLTELCNKKSCCGNKSVLRLVLNGACKIFFFFQLFKMHWCSGNSCYIKESKRLAGICSHGLYGPCVYFTYVWSFTLSHRSFLVMWKKSWFLSQGPVLGASCHRKTLDIRDLFYIL